jgi:hypothetical protein
MPKDPPHVSYRYGDGYPYNPYLDPKETLAIMEKLGLKPSRPDRAWRGEFTATDRYVGGVESHIVDIKASGVTTLAGIARELNHRKIPTLRGGKWRGTSVKKLLRKAALLEAKSLER